MAQLYHYSESGLDNVYLEGGVTRYKTADGDEATDIADTEGLHMAIGRWLIELPKPLNGAELRFLRLEMEITQGRLAALLGTSEQTISLWERSRKKAMPGSADRLLRVLYAEYASGDGSVRRMVDRLAELDQIKHAKACVRETRKGWRVEAEPRVVA